MQKSKSVDEVDEQTVFQRILASYWKLIVMLGLAACLGLAAFWTANAAMMLSYFSAESTATSVILQWGTASEINVEGYKILCKRQDEPVSAYHVIGTRIAKGGPGNPAAYEFIVTQDLRYGEQYCFRLEEVTTDDVPGELHDICGFGPGVTPTPAVGGTVISFDTTITPVVVTPPSGFQPPPTLITPVNIVPPGSETATPIGQSPLGTPLAGSSPTTVPLGATPTAIGGTPSAADATATAAADPFGFSATATAIALLANANTPVGADQPPSPLNGATATFTPTPLGQLDEFGNPLAASAGLLEAEITQTAEAVAGDSPLLQPTATSTISPTVMLTEMPTEMATATATPSPTLSDGSANNGTVGADDLATTGGAATPTQMYIVVTATDTPVVPSPVPTMTPLPMATPTPEFGLLNAVGPSAQNMTVLMLFLIFLSATGLGSLGLITAVLYYRSKS